MTGLNLASNCLCAEGAKIVAEAIKVTKCTPAIIFIPFSCPSGFSTNCCRFLLSYYPQDMGAMTSLDVSNNGIGAYYDRSKWVATPEGLCLSSNNVKSYMRLIFG
jgi:hypothetical protein